MLFFCILAKCRFCIVESIQAGRSLYICAMNYQLLIFLLLAIGQTGFSQNEDDPDSFRLEISRTTEKIKLDGRLDEAIWAACAEATDFHRQFPVDTGYSEFQTRVKMCFDDKFLYISAVCMQDQERITVQSLKRDFGNGTSDVLNILFDPFKDGLNGFAFGINPYNVQREALIDNGTTLSYDWDNKWYSEVRLEEDRWTAEIAIPFKTLRYKVSEGKNTWKFNLVRVRLNDWEVSSWYPTRLQFAANNLAFTGTLDWVDSPPKPGANISLLPYVNGSYSIDYQRNDTDMAVENRVHSRDFDAGGDAKIAIGPSLNLDLTFNPDFSQVEVDRQVTNLSRFELFFPERRQFFLENRDLFAMFGFPTTRPFFSRRIGLARNPATGFNENIPIIGGARLSGKLTDDWRIGLLNMQTRKLEFDSLNAIPASNYSVATLQRKVFGRSAISGIFVSRENNLSRLNEIQGEGYEAWHRNGGLEYNLYSKDNRWTGEWYYHRSFSPDEKKRGQTLAHFLGYRDRNWNFNTGYVLIDSFYTADAGFVPRNGIQRVFTGAGHTRYPESKRLNSWTVGARSTQTFALDWKEMDRELRVFINGTFKDQSRLEFEVWNNYTFLFADFDPSNLNEDGVLPLPGDTGYSYSGVRGSYNSTTAKDLQFKLSVRLGEFFNGTGSTSVAALSYRLQPVGLFTLNMEHTRIVLPEPYTTAYFWLVGARSEVSFSRSIFGSAFFQYNTQANNFNINARFQWRFAPASDIFLVYTDNSFAQAIPNSEVNVFSPKNKTIVLKAVYWLNL